MTCAAPAALPCCAAGNGKLPAGYTAVSMVMGRAPADGIWFTVMANQNTIVAALMADVACIVLTEGIRPDEAMLARARAEQIALATVELPSYQAALCADRILHNK